MKIPPLYKYRNLEGESFKYTQDIFINKRLYLATIPEFNDPNEGIGEILIENELKGWGNQLEERNRKKTRIFSISADYKNTLMWSHYSNNQKGICIKFNFQNFIDNKNKILAKVEYLKEPKSFPHNSMNNYFDFFKYKQIDWKYEKEWRIIANFETKFIDLTIENIEAIYLGPRFSDENLEWVKFWARNFNPNFEIPLIRMTYSSSKYDLIEASKMGYNMKRIII